MKNLDGNPVIVVVVLVSIAIVAFIIALKG